MKGDTKERILKVILVKMVSSKPRTNEEIKAMMEKEGLSWMNLDSDKSPMTKKERQTFLEKRKGNPPKTTSELMPDSKVMTREEYEAMLKKEGLDWMTLDNGKPPYFALVNEHSTATPEKEPK